jgi:hypothetical protein
VGMRFGANSSSLSITDDEDCVSDRPRARRARHLSVRLGRLQRTAPARSSHLRKKLAHFGRKRIPELAVHMPLRVRRRFQSKCLMTEFLGKPGVDDTDSIFQK